MQNASDTRYLAHSGHVGPSPLRPSQPSIAYRPSLSLAGLPGSVSVSVSFSYHFELLIERNYLTQFPVQFTQKGCQCTGQSSGDRDSDGEGERGRQCVGRNFLFQDFVN